MLNVPESPQLTPETPVASTPNDIIFKKEGYVKDLGKTSEAKEEALKLYLKQCYNT